MVPPRPLLILRYFTITDRLTGGYKNLFIVIPVFLFINKYIYKAKFVPFLVPFVELFFLSLGNKKKKVMRTNGTVRFRLKELTKNEKTIFLDFSYGTKKRLKYPIGYSVKEKH